MSEFLTFALENPALLLVPTIGALAAAALLLVKERYVGRRGEK
ncbi:hypothetical protein ABH945_003756 [Paraburkholderia sp. GAS333]